MKAAHLAALALVAACANDDASKKSGGDPPEVPAGHVKNAGLDPPARCPGDPACAPTSDPTLRVGAAKREITPVVDHVVAFAPRAEPMTFLDFNPLAGDVCVPLGACDPEIDYAACAAAAVDPMKCTWIAGFGIGRAATGVADPTWVRCAVIARGATKVGLCAIDNVGWFYNEVERTREEMADPELELDLLLVASTHVHQTQDTMGIWGPTDGQSGVKREYNALIRKMTSEALADANAALTPVRAVFGASTVDGHIAETDPGGFRTAAFVTDTRDPVVIDNELRAIRFESVESDQTIATLVNWTSHPEFADDQNTRTSSDYAHTLREGIEKGLDIEDASGKVLYSAPGVGGTTIFFNGALGGQVGPGEVEHVGWDGQPVPAGIERAYRNGELLAAYALEALSKGATTVETAALGFRAREIYVDVVNGAYHIAIAQALFDRDGEFYDPTVPLGETNVPAIRSQIAIVDIGPAELITVPGELHAELLLGTRDGVSALDAPFPFTPAPFSVTNDPATNPDCASQSFSRCNDRPPKIAAFDRTKVLDFARDPKAQHRWVLGLTPDTFGYLVPEFDYVLDAQNPYFNEAEGQHYEETNSVGTNVQHDYMEPMLQLMQSKPVIARE